MKTLLKNHSPGETGFFILRIGFAMGLALLLYAVYGLIFSHDAGNALLFFLRGPLVDPSSFLTFLERLAPLTLAALGVMLAFKAGLFNLGGEGQVYAGAVCSVLFATAFPSMPPVIAPALGLLAGAFGGALITAPSAVAGIRRGADVLLSTFLISQAGMLIVDWLVASPLRDRSSNIVATVRLAPAYLLERIAAPSALTVAAVIGPLAVFLMHRFMRFSRPGYLLRIYGKNPVFADSVGLPVALLPFWALAASGALHGMAGTILVIAQEGRLVRGLSGGLGWNAIGVALLAALKPKYCLPAAVLFAWLDSGARNASIFSDLSMDAGTVLKAVILFLVTVRFAHDRVKA